MSEKGKESRENEKDIGGRPKRMRRHSQFSIPMRARKRASAINFVENMNQNTEFITRHMRSRSSGIVRRKIKVDGIEYVDTFRGTDICNWLVRRAYAQNMISALELGNNFVKFNTIRCITEENGAMAYRDDVIFEFCDINSKKKIDGAARENKFRHHLNAMLTSLTENASKGRRIVFFALFGATRQIGAVVIVLAYIFGRWDMGISSAVLLFVSWCFYIGVGEEVQEIQRREQSTAEAVRNRNMSEIVDLTPPWVLYPDVESVTWLNRLVTQMWDNGLSKAVEIQVRELLEFKLDEMRSTIVRALRPVKCDFTHLRPTFMGVKVFDREHTRSRETATMDVDIEIVSTDPKAMLIAATLLTGTVHVAVGNIVVKGKLRLMFRDPWCYFMPFRLLNISFVHLPKIDFSLCAMTEGFDLNKIGGVRSTISSLVQSSLEEMMLFPRAFPYEMFDPMYEAKLRVAIAGAFIYDSADVFVKVLACGVEEKTKTVAASRNRNCKFNDEFKFVVTDKCAVCRIELWIKSLFLSDKMVGVAEFRPLVDSEERSLKEMWVNIESSDDLERSNARAKKRPARVHVIYQWSTIAERRELGEETSSKEAEAEASAVSKVTSPAKTKSKLRRKNSTLLDKKVEDKNLQMFQIARRICRGITTARFSGRLLLQWLLKNRFANIPKEAEIICEDMVQVGLIFSESYYRIGKGRKVYVVARESSSFGIDDVCSTKLRECPPSAAPSTSASSSKVIDEEDAARKKRVVRQGFVTAVGQEGTGRFCVVAFGASNESKLPEEKTFPLSALRPFDTLGFDPNGTYCVHEEVRWGNKTVKSALRNCKEVILESRIVSNLTAREAKRRVEKYLKLILLKGDTFVTSRSLHLLACVSSSPDMKDFLLGVSIELLERRMQKSNRSLGTAGAAPLISVPGGTAATAAAIDENMTNPHETLRFFFALCNSPNTSIRRGGQEVLRSIAAFDDGVGYLRYRLKARGLLTLVRSKGDSFVSALATNALLQRLKAWKAMDAMDLPVPKICGYLLRKTRKRASWRKRWFVVSSGCLYEYTNDAVKTSTKQHLHRKIFLAGCIVSTSTEKYQNMFGRDFDAFELRTPSGKNTEDVLYFTAQHDAHSKSWLLALEEEICEANTRNGVRDAAFAPSEDPATGKVSMVRKHATDIRRCESKSLSDPHIRGETFEYPLTPTSIGVVVRDRSAPLSSLSLDFSDGDLEEEKDRGDGHRTRPPAHTASKSTPNPENMGVCANCGARPDSHSRGCINCGVVYCKRCKKSQMHKIRSKTWKCFRPCATKSISDHHRSATSVISDDDMEEDKQTRSGTLSVAAKHLRKFGRRLHNIVGLRETQRLNIMSSEHLRVSHLVQQKVRFFQPLIEQSCDDTLPVMFRIHFANVLMHVLYFENHKVEKAQYPVWFVVKIVKAVLSTLKAYINADSKALVIPEKDGGVSGTVNSDASRSRRRMLTSLIMKRKDVLDIYAMARGFVLRTECIDADFLTEFDESLDLTETENRLIALFEANYTIRENPNKTLDLHYQGLIKLRQKILDESANQKYIRDSQLLAPRNSKRKKRSNLRVSKSNRISRRKSMFHATRFAEVHGDLLHTLKLRKRSDASAGDSDAPSLQ